MIDWITAILPCNHDHSKLMAGFVMSFDANGEQEWVSEKRLTVESSHSTKIQIRSHTDSSIWFSGNPAKFLQGHNIFGTDDLTYLVGRFFDELLRNHENLGLMPTAEQYERIQEGDYFLTRVDYNLSWLLKDVEQVRSWIRSASQSANLRHRGQGLYQNGTLYFGKNSQHWALKCYSKGSEIFAKGHELPEHLRIQELIDFANKALRLELVLRSKFLKSTHLNHAKNWCKNTGKELLLSCIRDDLQISDNMTLKDDVIDELPSRLRLTYQAWLNGDDLRAVLSRPTFYRYRKQLLVYGIDISVVQVENRTNVVPLIRYLEAVPAEIPVWAYEKGLVA